VAYRSERGGSRPSCLTLATARAIAPPAATTAAVAAAASRPPCMAATGSNVTTGGTSTATVSAARRRGLRPHSAATASRATGESTVHQNSAVMATAASEPGEMLMGMPPVYRRPAASRRARARAVS
jgi:hypothetical protein